MNDCVRIKLAQLTCALEIVNWKFNRDIYYITSVCKLGYSCRFHTWATCEKLNHLLLSHYSLKTYFCLSPVWRQSLRLQSWQVTKDRSPISQKTLLQRTWTWKECRLTHFSAVSLGAFEEDLNLQNTNSPVIVISNSSEGTRQPPRSRRFKAVTPTPVGVMIN